MKRVSIVGAAMLLLATPPAAQDPVKAAPVQFATGTGLKAIKRAIRGYATANYVVDASRLDGDGAHDDKQSSELFQRHRSWRRWRAMFNGSMAGDRFSTTIPSMGTYTVQVYLMRNAARRGESAIYTLDVALL
jgi:hypothetical protein